MVTCSHVVTERLQRLNADISGGKDIRPTRPLLIMGRKFKGARNARE